MNPIIKKNAVTFGLLTGLFSILITTLIYVIDLKLFLNMWFGISLIVIYIGIGIFLIRKTKKQLNNTISFKEAFTVYFLSAVIATTLSVFYNIILFNFIDPGVKDTLKDMSIRFSVEMMQKFNAPADQVDEAVAKMRESDNYSIKGLLTGMFTSYIISAVLGLILAAIFKTKSTYKE